MIAFTINRIIILTLSLQELDIRPLLLLNETCLAWIFSLFRSLICLDAPPGGRLL